MVREQLFDLDEYESREPHRLHPRIPKKLADVASEPWHHVFQKSWSTGEVPEDWKREKNRPRKLQINQSNINTCEDSGKDNQKQICEQLEANKVITVLTSKVQNECAKGAAYWCSNLMTAIKCGALDHCVQNGWNQASNESVWNRISNDDMCADCKQLISILVRMAKESTFKETLQKYLEHECTNLPLQTLIPQCQALVKDFFARLIASLEEQFDPSIICAQLGACPADLLGSKDGLMQLLTGLEQLLLLLPGQMPILPSGHTQESPQELLPIPLPLCWLCRTFIGKAESVIPKAAIGKAMSKLCYILPGAVAGMCQCLMEKYTVIIVDTIVSKLGPRLICGMMFMCASEENCGPESLLPATAEGCQMCLMVSDQVKASLRANRTRRAVEAALSTACSRSFSFWPQCNHFIHQHQPKLSALLMKPWDSQATCQELGACGAEQLLPSATPCAQGPTYWCSSLSAAKQCKAIQHCQDHAWL
ncbi:pulmonary surfactant-associated protein B isoform X2 [Crotalus tigris]|uniref:pulmonary surfactant-associated protein B isoform X2 n=1 Tax=Crotalus tigris TaxID=88082 RepID=UPI00192F7E84|nr:pulmonary surfactant-associated protein B isoform X2 [Crotalus tigris]